MSRGQHLYFIGASDIDPDDDDSMVKIGRAEDVEQRLRELQSGCPVDLAVLDSLDDMGFAESTIHELFRSWRRKGSEWFSRAGEILCFAEALGQSRTPKNKSEMRKFCRDWARSRDSSFDWGIVAINYPYGSPSRQVGYYDDDEDGLCIVYTGRPFLDGDERVIPAWLGEATDGECAEYREKYIAPCDPDWVDKLVGRAGVEFGKAHPVELDTQWPMVEPRRPLVERTPCSP